MRKLAVLVILILSVFLLLEMGFAQSSIPSTLGWYQIPNTQMQNVCQNGVDSCYNVVAAWNSGVMDTLRNRLIIWGGGHNDYGGNEIYALNLSGTPAFVRLNNNTNPSGCGMPSCDGGVTPNARHTYDGLAYMANLDKMFVFGGASSNGGSPLNDIWTFDFASMTWQFMGAPPTTTNSTGPHACFGCLAAYDPNTGSVFIHDNGGFFKYTYSTNTLIRVSDQTQGNDNHQVAVIDPKRKRFYIFGNGQQWYFDISNPNSYDATFFHSLTTTGDQTIVNAGGYPGVAYDPVSDRIVGWTGGDTVYSLNGDTLVWTPITYSGGPGASIAAGIDKHWNYSPALGAFVLVNSTEQNAYTLKLENGTPPPPDSQPPTTPSSPTANAISSSQINLSWTASTDNVAVSQYMVERCQGSSCTNFAQIGAAPATTYSDTGLAAATTYNYRVRATDAAGNFSSYSSSVSATTQAAPPPPPPIGSGLTLLIKFGATSAGNLFGLTGWNTPIKDVYTDDVAFGPGGTTIIAGNNYAYNYQGVTGSAQNFAAGDTIIVNWYNNSASSLTFTPNISFTDPDRNGMGVTGTWYAMSQATVPAFGTATTQYTFTASTAGSYSLVNVNNNYTNTDILVCDKIQYLSGSSVSGDTQAPTAPTSLVATASSSTEIDLSWTASTDNVGVAGYLVERCLGSSCSSFVQIATPSGTTYSDTGLTTSSSYSYRVRATDLAHNLSSYSSVVSATTQGPPPSTGTLQVGVNKPYTTIGAAVAAAVDGNTIQIDAGTYPETVTITQNNLTLVGVGGLAHMVWGTGNYLTNGTNYIPNDKGLLIISGNGDTVQNMEFSGAIVADQNGAGIRYQGGDLTIRGSYFHDNEDGILGQGGLSNTLLIEHSTFERNGYCPSACDHNLYIGNMGHFIFRYNRSVNSNEGHTLKSRAQVNEIIANYLSTVNSTGSYEADFPNGGTVYFIGNVVEQGANSDNSTLLIYGEEGATNPNLALYAVNNTFYNWRTNGATFIQVLGSPTLSIINNIFAGGGTNLVGGSTDLSSNLSFGDSSSFVNAVAGNYNLVAASPAINAGVAPGTAPGGYNLTPQWQYVDPANAVARVTVGSAIDAGAYEFGSSVSSNPPTISLTAPSAGATVSGSSVTLTATASATSPATISSVQFKMDGTNIGSPVTASSPYSTNWNSTTVANGSHSLTAVATDSNNMQTVSATVSLTVNNSTSVPPALTTVSPGSGFLGTVVPVTLTGTNFVGVTGISVSGTGVTVSDLNVGSSTSITATFTIAPNATLGALNVTATTSSGTSNVKTFTVSTPPAPALTSVSPNSGGQGNAVPVTLTGTSFISGASVAVNGTGVTVSNVNVVSSTSITATFTIAANATVGAHNVTVTTSSGASNTATFTVSAPSAPALTTVSPNSGGQGNAVPVTLTGTSFIGGASVAVNGTGVTVSNVNVVSSTSITATFTIAANATVGAHNVTVTTSSGTSNTATFTVSAPSAPALTTVTPNSGSQGNAVPVTLTGTNFVSGASVAVNGAGITVSNVNVVSSTSITATFTIASNATVGADNVTVTTSAGTSAAQVFTVGTPQSNPAPNFNIPTHGGVSFVTGNFGTGSTTLLHAHVTSGSQSSPDMASASSTSAGDPGLTGVAIIGLTTNAGLISETGVPASPEILSGRIYIETIGPVNTGLALSNSGMQDALITFYFTDQNGMDYGSGSFTLPANQEIAAFSNQPPFNGPANAQGTLTFWSSAPVSAIALRGLTNERSEFLMSTLPVAQFGVAQNSAAVISQFADGGGWSSQVVLVNSSDALETGTVQFVGPGSSGQSGQVLYMTVNGVSGTTFNYTVQPHGSVRLATAGLNAAAQVGSVQINAVPNSFSTPAVPVAFAILSLRNNGVTVSEASIPAGSMSSSFQLYLESSGSFGAIGSIDSGVAIANPSLSPATVSLSLTALDGSSVGSPVNITVPSNGQVARFISELFPGLPASFQGLGQLTTTTPNIAVAALRGRYNQRGDFLMTTTPPANDMVPGISTFTFPHVVSGLGFGTQIVMFGQPGGGTITLLDQKGNTEPTSVLVPGP
jgi:hypothetical protein